MDAFSLLLVAKDSEGNVVAEGALCDLIVDRTGQHQKQGKRRDLNGKGGNGPTFTNLPAARARSTRAAQAREIPKTRPCAESVGSSRPSSEQRLNNFLTDLSPCVEQNAGALTSDTWWLPHAVAPASAALGGGLGGNFTDAAENARQGNTCQTPQNSICHFGSQEQPLR